MAKLPSISIIVPVFNEEDHIAAFLDSVRSQTVLPEEVLVIDNNSTDSTVEIAKQYPFVKVLHAKKQGVVFARNVGFDAAKCSVIGRFNADVVLDSNWVKRTKEQFVTNPSHMIAGYVQTKLVPSVEWPYTIFWTAALYRATRVFFGTTLLWGANMALTKKAWQSVKDKAATDTTQLHEDVDIGLCIFEKYKIEAPLKSEIKVCSAEQSYHYWPKLRKYIAMYYQTYKRHKKTLRNLGYRPGFHTFLDAGALLFAGVFILSSLICFPFAWLYRKIN